VDVVKEDAELRPNTITLALSGVDTAVVNSAMTEAYHGRAVRIYQGLFDVDTLALAATPETVFVGMMDLMTVALGQNSGSISVSCESEFARWQRPRGLLYTNESQQLLYAGDTFFDLIPAMQTREVSWAKKGTVGWSTGAGASRGAPPK
jgi:hypothetical protein